MGYILPIITMFLGLLFLIMTQRFVGVILLLLGYEMLPGQREEHMESFSLSSKEFTIYGSIAVFIIFLVGATMI